MQYSSEQWQDGATAEHCAAFPGVSSATLHATGKPIPGLVYWQCRHRKRRTRETGPAAAVSWGDWFGGPLALSWADFSEELRGGAKLLRSS